MREFLQVNSMSVTIGQYRSIVQAPQWNAPFLNVPICRLGKANVISITISTGKSRGQPSEQSSLIEMYTQS